MHIFLCLWLALSPGADVADPLHPDNYAVWV